MQAQLKILDLEKKWWNGDRISLWLGQTNNFGANWGKPLWLSLAITLLFFPFMAIAADNTISMRPSCSVEGLEKFFSVCVHHFGAFFQMLNPARIPVRMFPDMKLSWDLYALDFVHRIILAFLIYQIIVAFRKYVK